MDNIPLEKEFIGMIEDTVDFLREIGYTKVIRLPYSEGNIFSIVNDFAFFMGRKNSIFKNSFLYSFRRWLFPAKELVLLSDLFLHNKKISYPEVSSLLGEERVKNLMKLKILSQNDGNSLLKSQIRIIPFNGEYFVCDPFDRTIPDFVWIGSDSLLLAARLKCLNYNGKLAVDIGSGSGIQAIVLPTAKNTKVIAIDINERGLRYAKLNALINKKTNLYCVKSDMLSAIKSGIDVIVSNPPFVFLPPSQQSVNRDGYGGVFGLEKITYILERLQEYLNPGGRAVILTLSPVINGKDILKEELKKLLDKNYVIDYRIVDYVYNSEFKFFYDSKNISYFIQAILEISKNGNSGAGKIAVQDIPAVKKSFSFVKIIGKKLFAKNYVNAV